MASPLEYYVLSLCFSYFLTTVQQNTKTQNNNDFSFVLYVCFDLLSPGQKVQIALSLLTSVLTLDHLHVLGRFLCK